MRTADPIPVPKVIITIFSIPFPTPYRHSPSSGHPCIIFRDKEADSIALLPSEVNPIVEHRHIFCCGNYPVYGRNQPALQKKNRFPVALSRKYFDFQQTVDHFSINGNCSVILFRRSFLGTGIHQLFPVDKPALILVPPNQWLNVYIFFFILIGSVKGYPN